MNEEILNSAVENPFEDFKETSSFDQPIQEANPSRVEPPADDGQIRVECSMCHSMIPITDLDSHETQCEQLLSSKHIENLLSTE